jgi:phospholipid/cholesterol/gamma-HCH transport system permease protein
VLQRVESLGRGAVRGLDQAGFAGALFGEALFWSFAGHRWRQPVRLSAVFAEMVEIGIRALPIATLLAATVGLMLAIQSLYSLGLFGAQSFAYVGIALAVTREFAPLIVGILVAGRSGSALAARLGIMSINQEIDALRAIGVNPVRFLVAPALLAMLVMLPVLTMWADLVALAAAGLYVSAALDLSMAAYVAGTIELLTPGDLMHGLGKSALFAVLIVMLAVVNGARVEGGAEGLGKATTRSVVQATSAIVVTDMVFAFVATQ